MEKFAHLVARRDHRYAGRLRRIGTTYTAPERHARLLVLTKRAQRDPAAPAPVAPSAPAAELEPIAHPLTSAEVRALVAEAARDDHGRDDSPEAPDQFDEPVEQTADDSAGSASLDTFSYLRDD